MQEQQRKKEDETRLRGLALPLLGKWVPFILILLSQGTHSFSDLERKMTGVSRKVLNENLINLQASGIISKEGKASTGFPVSYRLTKLGESSLFILHLIKDWLKEHEEEIVENQKAFYDQCQ